MMFGKNEKKVSDVQPVIAAARTFGKTHKKKNTYVLKLNNIMADLTLFGLCDDTPMVVAKKNGQQLLHCGWVPTKDFPNPAAQNILKNYPEFSPIMGELAATVVEYLDKDTGMPVMQLYPNNMVCVFDGYEQDFMSRINHASRRDFKYQVRMREQMMGRIGGMENSGR